MASIAVRVETGFDHEAVVEQHRGGERLQDAACQVRDGGQARRVGVEGDELVAADPGDQLVGRGDAVAQPVGDGDQQPVAHRVAEAVVDRLEAVQVEVADADPAVGAVAAPGARLVRCAERAVEAFEERRFDAIALERRSVPATPEDAVPALLAAVRELGLAALPWSDHVTSLRRRVNALREWNPALGLPDFSDDALLGSLEDWLAPYLSGKRRLDALQASELSEALSARLDHAMRRALDEQAPTAITVPSGMQRRIDYADAAPPVLAVKLQELFGLADTPRVGGGRVPLTLHLLSPGGKPVQVTQDLRSFWERTYPEVKKELKGRYPKHPWPDDPWSAAPTHRAKPRGT